ncbi:molybdopterin-containing oxidoreductase family protein [Shewanella marina]|uniref:molybdopterin-containing oxidoreductase family protein n=1 Tax=Shewanella marina TaxID=487319 RepID=UPI000471C8EE|nr:molybdopterin-dependent oxidoreductase [Shewanella marina]
MNQQTKITTCGLCSTGCRLTITQTAPQQYKVSGDKNDPVTHGALCKKGLHAIDLMLHPARLTQPLKRIGARGAGQWQPISWQQAITETAEQFNQSQQRYGNNSLFFSYGYSKDFINTQLLRLANHCNSVNIHGPETVCWAPTKFGREYTLGYNPSNDVNQHTECIIFWGVNKHNTRFTDMPAINQAIDAGATTICIDPQRSYHAKQADYWLALTPGSDLALALAMLKIVIDSNQYDHQFVSQYCLGFTELSEHLQAFSLTELANQCGVNLDLIKEITEHYITAKPAIIMSGNALDHNPDSLQVNRVIAMLMAISGNLEMTGGHSRPQGATLINGRWPYDENDVNHCDAKARANSVGTPAIPEYFRATSQGLTQAMLTAKPYPIKAGLIVGSNPLLSWPDSQQVKQAFEQLDFLAVSELFMTPTALMADIVFPAASFMEYQGISQGQDVDSLPRGNDSSWRSKS